MLFLVDGYNATMRAPRTAGLSKEAQRDAIVTRLAAVGRRVLGAGRIAVVFDARSAYGSSSESVAGVSVVYAPDADTEIVRRATAAPQVCVVTDDMRLRARLSQDVGRHVVFRDTGELFADTATSGPRHARPVVGHEDRLSPKAAKDITAELAELWLDDEKD
jgi:rRNA-processing protein FCF1